MVVKFWNLEMFCFGTDFICRNKMELDFYYNEFSTELTAELRKVWIIQTILSSCYSMRM